MRKLSVYMLINGLFSIFIAILLLITGVKIYSALPDIVKPGMDIFVYFWCAGITFVMGVISISISVAVKEDANRLDEIWAKIYSNKNTTIKNQNKKVVIDNNSSENQNKKVVIDNNSSENQNIHLTAEEYVKEYDPDSYIAIKEFYSEDEKEFQKAIEEKYKSLKK